MPRVYTMLLKVTRIRLRIIATDCTWSTSLDVEVLIFRKQAQVSVTLVKVLVAVRNYTGSQERFTRRYAHDDGRLPPGQNCIAPDIRVKEMYIP